MVQFPLSGCCRWLLGFMFGLHSSEQSGRWDSLKDLKGPLTKFPLVIYYLPCLAGTGLVAWLSNILNFHSGTCHLSACLHPAPEKEQQRSRAEICKGHCVRGQEFGPGHWSTRLFDDSDCRSVCAIRNGRKASPLSIVSYRDRSLFHSHRADLRMQSWSF